MVCHGAAAPAAADVSWAVGKTWEAGWKLPPAIAAAGAAPAEAVALPAGEMFKVGCEQSESALPF